MMRKSLLAFAILLASALTAANVIEDTSFQWDFRVRGGAEGEVLRPPAHKPARLIRRNNEGQVLLLNKTPIPLTPGKSYKVIARVRRLEGEPNVIMVLTMGGKRRPFPRKDFTLPPVGTPMDLVMTFQAREDETRLHASIYSTAIGVLAVESFECLEEGGATSASTETNWIEDPKFQWDFRVRGGAEGEVLRPPAHKPAKLIRRNDEGQVLLLNKTPIPLTPGKSYKVTAKVRRLEGEPNVIMVLTMGGKRRPFPRKDFTLPPVGTSMDLVMTFQAREDETRLHASIYSTATGVLAVDSFTCQEYDASKSAAVSLRSFQCAGPELKKYVECTRAFQTFSSSPFVEAIFPSQGGGYFTLPVDWQANQIQSLEVEYRAFHEPGCLILEYTAEHNGRKQGSFFGQSMPPSGEFQPIRFRVSDDVNWKGRITELRLKWSNLYIPPRLAIRSIRARGIDNLIPFAERALKGPIQVEELRPRGRYHLKRENGGTAPAYRLNMMDARGNTISSIELPKGVTSLDFNADPLVARATLTADSAAGDAPLLQLAEMPSLTGKGKNWRAFWIWCQNSTGPLDTHVCFRRRFELDSEPVIGWFAGTADDQLSMSVNGVNVAVTKRWDYPERADIRPMLRAGKNEIILDAFNHQAWGGVLGEFYIKTASGREYFLLTDKNWECRIGQSGEFNHPTHIIGAVPVMPWGNRVHYCYAGPIAKVRLTSMPTDGNILRWKATLAEPSPVDTDELEFECRMPDGARLRKTGHISPSTGKWPVGQEFELTATFPPLVTGAEGVVKVMPRPPFLDVEGTEANLHVSKPKRLEFPVAKITNAGGRCWFQVDGKRIAPFSYYLPDNFLAAPAERSGLVKDAANSGLRVIRFGHRIGEIWKAEETYDFDKLDTGLETVASHAPDAFIILHIGTYMPRWWLQKHPDEQVGFYGNEPLSPSEDFQSIASELWLQECEKYLGRLIEHLRMSPFASRVIGISLSDGTTYEWLYSHGRGHKGRVYSGWSPAGISSYRKWLRNKYKTDSALAKAWNRPDATLANALPPTPQRIDNSSVGHFLLPEKDHDIIDWSEYCNDRLADAWLGLCKMVKDLSGGRLLTGSYYGYLVQFSWMYFCLQDAGHRHSGRVARSPYADYVICPTMYRWRHLGGADGLQNLAGAYTLHGKPVICELDYRTFSESTERETGNGKMSTASSSVAMLNRGFGMMAAQGMGGHYYEMYMRWFREPVIQAAIKSHHNLYYSLPEKEQGLVPSQVAIVSDEFSPALTKTHLGGGIHTPLIEEIARTFPKVGVAYRHVLLPDLLESNVLPPQKFYIMTNLFSLTQEQRSALMARFRSEKATVLWLYAPGVFVGEQGPSPDNISKFLGVRFEMTTAPREMRVNFENPAEFGGVKTANSGNQCAPWFLPVSGFEKVIARTPEGKPAIVSWKADGVNHIFCAVPNPPTPFMAKLAEQAGVHVFNADGDAIWAGNDFVTIHTVTAGRKKIRLPVGTAMKQVLGPQVEVAKDGSFPAAAGETYVFLLTK